MAHVATTTALKAAENHPRSPTGANCHLAGSPASSPPEPTRDITRSHASGPYTCISSPHTHIVGTRSCCQVSPRTPSGLNAPSLPLALCPVSHVIRTCTAHTCPYSPFASHALCTSAAGRSVRISSISPQSLASCALMNESRSSVFSVIGERTPPGVRDFGLAFDYCEMVQHKWRTWAVRGHQEQWHPRHACTREYQMTIPVMAACAVAQLAPAPTRHLARAAGVLDVQAGLRWAQHQVGVDTVVRRACPHTPQRARFGTPDTPSCRPDSDSAGCCSWCCTHDAPQQCGSSQHPAPTSVSFMRMISCARIMMSVAWPCVCVGGGGVGERKRNGQVGCGPRAHPGRYRVRHGAAELQCAVMPRTSAAPRGWCSMMRELGRLRQIAHAVTHAAVGWGADEVESRQV